MKYRKFGFSEWRSSILGFGAASLRLCENAPASSGATAAVKIIRLAIDRGINYLNLGYPYNLRQQEQIAGAISEALLDGCREKIKIAVTLPIHLLNSASDFDLSLDRQVNLLKADRADFCLFGGLNRETWPLLQRFEAQDWAEAALAAGRVGAVGFSFYDDFQVLRRILGEYDRWSLCQFRFSFMDISRSPGIGGIKYAASKGLAVVVTEPLRSGRLIKRPPTAVARIWGDECKGSRLAKWGLRFVWSYPEIAVAVRDFSSTRDLIKSADIADSVELDSLTVQEELLINTVRDEYLKLSRIPCTSCRPCMPCPEGIDVPRIFELYNDAFIYEDLKTARLMYLKEQHHAELCTQCRDCEKRCARELKIVDWLEQAHKLLGESD